MNSDTLKNKKAYLFITHHPDQLSLYKNLVTIVKASNENNPVLLIRVNHPYFATFNFEPYKDCFDHVIDLPFIYQRNVLRAIRDLIVFKKRLVKIKKRFSFFSHIKVFASHSAWLPINILMRELNEWKNVQQIYRCIVVNSAMLPHKKFDLRRTIFYTFYSLLANILLLPTYSVKAVKSQKGDEFVGFLYTQKVPGVQLRTTNPAQKSLPSINDEEMIIPYPLIIKTHSYIHKDMIVLFGDTRILTFTFREYVTDYNEAVKKLTIFFERLENYYAGYKLYYKPHPMDKEGELTPGMDQTKYHLFDNSINAQTILDSYHDRIKAVYTFFSTSIIWSSFYGIPSYTLYQYIYNAFGIARMNDLFMQEGTASDLIFHISRLDQIGKNDNLMVRLQTVDFKNLKKTYGILL